MGGRMAARGRITQWLELETPQQRDFIITQEKNEWERVCKTTDYLILLQSLKRKPHPCQHQCLLGNFKS